MRRKRVTNTGEDGQVNVTDVIVIVIALAILQMVAVSLGKPKDLYKASTKALGAAQGMTLTMPTPGPAISSSKKAGSRSTGMEVR